MTENNKLVSLLLLAKYRSLEACLKSAVLYRFERIWTALDSQPNRFTAPEAAAGAGSSRRSLQSCVGTAAAASAAAARAKLWPDLSA